MEGKTCARQATLDRMRKNSKRYYAAHKEAVLARMRLRRSLKSKPDYKPKRCGRCHIAFQPTSSNQKYCDQCRPIVRREWSSAHAAEWRGKYPERAKEAIRSAKEKHRERYLGMQKTWTARSNRGARRKVFTHYSGVEPMCACCGENEIDFLTIDHVKGGGGRERMAIFGRSNTGGVRFYRWLMRNGFPPGYAVLCMNCNSSKGAHGLCAHSLSRLMPQGSLCFR